jgi:hypothetical protein
MARRRIAFTKYGFAENPVGLLVSWQQDGTRLGDVVGAKRDYVTGNRMLLVRTFNREKIVPVVASIAWVLEPDAGDYDRDKRAGE